MTSLLARLSFLAQESTAPAAGGATTTAPGAAWVQPVVMVLFIAGFYFLLIRPQMKQQKELAKKQSALKSGDKVATSSGIVGKVVSLDDSIVTLELSTGVRIPFRRAHIVEFQSEEAKA